MIGNCFTLTLPSYRRNESVAVNAVAAFVNQLDPTDVELGDIRTSVSEAFSNCVEYAYPGKVGEINVRCQILKNNVISIVIRDKGIGIKNVWQARQPMFTTGGAEHSGMGFTIIEAFMTDCSVTRRRFGSTCI